MTPFQTTCFAAFLAFSIPSALLAADDLPGRIDAAVRKGSKDHLKEIAPKSTDAEFLRRVTLDLTGIIPTATEARQFFDDKNPDKRTQLVDKLLASPRHAQHLQEVFDVLLQDRRPDKNVKNGEWRDFLRKSFAANKPYDQLVREILSADGVDPKNRAAAAFFLNRDGEPHQITKDISRIFLGMNMQCAQCHDHPLVDHYKQDFYFGIFAFLNRSYLFTDKATKFSILAEKADGEVSFQSVFVAKVTKNTGPRLPEGKELKEPKFDKGQEYEKPVKAGERGIPKYSRRAQLAEQIVGEGNTRFPRATMNRLWFLMFGRGIIHPVEFDHPENPPSHPELIDLLTKEFVASKYDLRAMIRAIVLSDTYQRSSEVPATVKDVEAKWFMVSAIRPLSPEQMAASLLQGFGMFDIERKIQGAKATDASVAAKYQAQLTQVINLFAPAAGEPAVNLEFEASLDQTLFLANSPIVRDWLQAKGDDLVDRMLKLPVKENDKIAEELYISMLTRRPTTQEAAEVADFLQKRSDKRLEAIQNLVWALATSAEFRFNH